MSVVTMCAYYYWKNAPKCERGHRAGIKCHDTRKDCPDYLSTQDDNKHRDKYKKWLEG